MATSLDKKVKPPPESVAFYCSYIEKLCDANDELILKNNEKMDFTADSLPATNSTVEPKPRKIKNRKKKTKKKILKIDDDLSLPTAASVLLS